VQDGAFFGDINLVATEHGVTPFREAGFFREPKQQLQGLVGDAILGIVEEETGGLGCEVLAAFRVLGEKVAKMEFADSFTVRCESFPCRTLG